MPDYRLIIMGEGQDGKSVINTQSADVLQATPLNAQQAGSAFGKNIANQSINRALISPLNSATGGLASPVYQVGRGMATGASAAAIGGGLASLAIAGVMLAVNEMGKRVARMEAKAEEMNNRDNLMIRAGSKETPTNYNGGLFGIKTERNQ